MTGQEYMLNPQPQAVPQPQPPQQPGQAPQSPQSPQPPQQFPQPPQQPGQAPPQPPQQPGQAPQSPQQPEDVYKAAMGKLSEEEQALIGQVIFRQGQEDAMTTLYQQGMIKEPETSPKGQGEPGPEDRILADFRNGLNEILRGAKNLPPEVQDMLGKLFEYAHKKTVHTATGLSQHLTQEQVAKQTEDLNAFMIQAAEDRWFQANQDLNEHRDIIQALLQKPPEKMRALDFANAIRQIRERDAAKIRTQMETQARQEPDAYGGYMESTRGRVSPEVLAGRKELAKQALDAADKDDEAALNAALDKWVLG